MERLTIQMWMLIVLVVIGLSLHLTSFAAPYWNRIDSDHWGLWQSCSERECVVLSNENVSDIMGTGRAFQTIATVAYVTLAVMVAMYVFWKRSSNVVTGALVTTIVIVFCVFLGAILWASASNTSLSWCYHLCYVGGLLAATSGGVLLHIRRQDFFKQDMPQGTPLNSV